MAQLPERHILTAPKINIPSEAIESGLGGRVIVSVTVDAAGKVLNVNDISGPGPVCPSVRRPDVDAIITEARSAALRTIFAVNESNGSTLEQIIFEFPSKAVQESSVGERHFNAAPAADYTGPVATNGSSSGTTPDQSGNAGEKKDISRDPDTTPRPLQITGGVLNGKAQSLPRPAYPPAARAVRASGAVAIQVLIDEEGSVFSAAAVSGHPLLRMAARNAACDASFQPTRLMGLPVKVSGVITYNFVP